MHISVVVPAYQSEKTIRNCLEAIKASSYKDIELIVVDDGSSDATKAIAAQYADKVIINTLRQGRGAARTAAFRQADGELIVNVDSDVVVCPDTLEKIIKFFEAHPEIDALTGILSKKHPNKNFFSQYKNLYMHYIFSKLPEEVSFLYGSIFGLRREVLADIAEGEDTELGQLLVSRGHKIGFCRSLEVVHAKSYNLPSFIKNDFLIPARWAGVYLKHKGWRQAKKFKTGFAHASVGQLASITCAVAICVLIPFSSMRAVAVLTLFVWVLLNAWFILFLSKERGVVFGVLAIFVTFFDNVVMALGIIYGSIEALTKIIFKK